MSATAAHDIGLTGDIARHLETSADLSDDFLSGWHLALYGEVRGLGIAVWTSALLAAAFTVVLVRFRLLPGALVVACSLVAVPGLVVEGGGDRASLVAVPASAPPVSTLAAGSHPSDLAEP